ncbi:uncharacterized protein METZ01_LOCUS355436, partial [marine metagenome]
MATAIIMPKLGQSVESCIIVEWKKEVGDEITQGEVICEVETDKALLEVDSSVSGTILEIFFQAGDEVSIQTNIAAVGALGENASYLRPSNMTSVKAMATVDNGIDVPADSHTVDPQLLVVSKKSDLNSNISPRANALAKKLRIDSQNVLGTGPNDRIMEKDVQLISIIHQPLT